MFGFSPVGYFLLMLIFITFRLLQVFCTCKDNFIPVLCMSVWSLSTNVSHITILCMCPFGQKQCFPPLVPISQTIIQVGLLIIQLDLMCASVGLTSWMSSEFHSSVNLEASYKFCKVPTSLWSLVDVQTFLTYWYTFRDQKCLHDGKSSY